MRVIAVTNQKGGVGKTTTTVNLAAALAEQGRRVILADLDPQAHMTTCFGLDPQRMEKTAYDVLAKSMPLAEALIPVRERLQLLASGMDLAAAEQELVSVVGRETILRDAIEDYSEECDYFFIDCPPSLGLLTLNAMGAAREVFIPLQPHFLSLQGLSQLLETVLLVQRRINPRLRVTGLMFCMYDSRTSLSTEIIRDIGEFLDQQRGRNAPWSDVKMFETRIRRNIKLAESPSHGQTIFEYERNCNGARDHLALADEVEAMFREPGVVCEGVDRTIAADNAVVSDVADGPVVSGNSIGPVCPDVVGVSGGAADADADGDGSTRANGAAADSAPAGNRAADSEPTSPLPGETASIGSQVVDAAAADASVVVSAEVSGPVGHLTAASGSGADSTSTAGG